jgi:GAF domain-containing protein
MALVDDVAKIVTSTLNIQDVYERFATEIKELVDFDRVTIATIDQAMQTTLVKYTFGDTLPGRNVGDVVPLRDTTSDLVVTLGAPVFRGDLMSVTADHGSAEEGYQKLGFHSSAIIPLISRGRLIRTMGLRSRRSHAFGLREQAILLRLADQIAPAVENALLFEQSKESEETQRRLAEENAAMAKIGRIIGSPLSDEAVYRQFADSVQSLVQFDRITITTLDSSADNTSSEYIIGLDVPGWGKGTTLRMDRVHAPFITKIMSTDIPLLLDPETVEDLQEDYPTLVDFYRAGLRSFLGCRLVANDRVIGTLQLASCTPGRYRHHESQLLERIGNQVAGSIASSLLFQVERKRFDQLEALYKVADILAKPISFESKAQSVIEALVNVSRADQIILRRVDGNRENLELVATAGAGNIVFEPTISISKQVSASSEAFRQGRILTINDYQSFPNANPNILAQGVESTLVVPIASGGQTLGLLSVSSRTPNFFSEEGIALHSAFASELGTLFESEALSDALQASQDELALADEIATIVTTAIELDQVYGTFSDALKDLVDFDIAGIIVIDLQRCEGTVRYLSSDFGREFESRSSFPLSHTISDRVVETKNTIVLGKMENDNDLWPTINKVAMGYRSTIAVPLISDDAIFGTFVLKSRKINAYGYREQAVVERLAKQISPALKNAELHGETRRLGDENASMAKIGRIIASPFSTEGVYDEFARAVQSLIPFDRIAITSCDTQGSSIFDLHVWGTPVADWAEGDLLPAERSGFATAVMAERNPLVTPKGTNQLGEEYPSLLKFSQAGLRCIVGCALVSNDQIVGTIFLSSSFSGAYTDHESGLLQRISNQIAGSIASARLLTTEQERTNQLEALYRVSAMMSQQLSFEAKCEVIVDALVDISHVDKVVLRRVVDRTDLLELVAEAHDDGASTENLVAVNDRNLVRSRAFHEGRPIVVNDYQNHPDAEPSMVARGLKSALSIPIRSAEKTLGLISMGSNSANHFTEDRIAMLTAFANEVASIFETDSLSATLQASQEEMALADDIAKIVTSTLDLDSVYDRFAAEAKNLLTFDRVNIGVIDHDDETLTVKYAFGPEIPRHRKGQVLKLGSSRNLAVIKDGVSIFIDDLAEEAETRSEKDYLAAGIRSSAVVPLVSKGRAIGALGFRSNTPGSYGPREQAIIFRLANLIAPAVENAQLHEASLLLANENASLAEIGRIVASPLSDEVVYRNFADAVQALIPFDRIAITTLDSSGEQNLMGYTLGTEVQNWQEFGLNRLPSDRVPFITAIKSMERPLILNPKGTDELKESYPTLVEFYEDGLRSFIGCRLMSNNQVIGTLQLNSSISGHFGQNEARLLERIGNQVAGSIASATLRVAERNRSNQLEAIYEVAAIKSQPISFEAKSQKIVETLDKVSEANHVILRLFDEVKGTLELVATAGTGEIETPQSVDVSMDSASIGAFRDARQLIINDYDGYPGAVPSILDQGIASIFVNPIRSDGRTLGLLNIVSKDAGHFNSERVALLTAFGDEIGSLFDTAGLSKFLRDSREEMALADEISAIVSSTLDLEEICDRFTAELKKLMDFDRSTLSTPIYQVTNWDGYPHWTAVGTWPRWKMANRPSVTIF